MVMEYEDLREDDFEDAMIAISAAIDDFSETLHLKGRYEITWDDKRHSRELYRANQLLATIRREKYPNETKAKALKE
mgnify:CR=1 FL=1